MNGKGLLGVVIGGVLGSLVYYEVVKETTALFIAFIGVAAYFGDRLDRLDYEIKYLKSKIDEEE